jgi:hypothetical protein
MDISTCGLRIICQNCDWWWLVVWAGREAGYQVAFVVTPGEAHGSPGCVSVRVISFTVCSRCEDSSWVTLCGSDVTFAFSLTVPPPKDWQQVQSDCLRLQQARCSSTFVILNIGSAFGQQLLHVQCAVYASLHLEVSLAEPAHTTTITKLGQGHA